MSSAMQSLMTDEEWKQLEKEVDEELRLEAARKDWRLIMKRNLDPYKLKWAIIFGCLAIYEIGMSFIEGEKIKKKEDEDAKCD